MEVAVIHKNEGTTYLSFYCEGCGRGHTVRVGGQNPWQWNGDKVHPTLSPSVLLTMEPPHDATEKEREYAARQRCHSYVRDGMIQYLNDCGHELACKTVPLKPAPEGYNL